MSCWRWSKDRNLQATHCAERLAWTGRLRSTGGEPGGRSGPVYPDHVYQTDGLYGEGGAHGKLLSTWGSSSLERKTGFEPATSLWQKKVMVFVSGDTSNVLRSASIPPVSSTSTPFAPVVERSTTRPKAIWRSSRPSDAPLAYHASNRVAAIRPPSSGAP